MRWTRITRTGRGGPFRVGVLAVDRSLLRWRVGVLSGQDRVPGLERLSAIGRRHEAVAGINGSYFAVGAPDVGDPTGLVVDDGAVLSEPVGARTAFLVPKAPTEPVRVAALRWSGSLAAAGSSRVVDGVNRNRGRIPSCGGVGGDRPTERVDPRLTCTDASELVVLTPAFGASTRTAPGGHEAVVRGGVVESVRPAADTAIPLDGYVLSGSGDAGRFLRDHLAPGDTPRLGLDLLDGAKRLSPGDYAAIVGGAPRLVRRGRVDLPAGLEGREGLDTGRHPRSIAGVRADGTILLITIDGRRPRWSLGATLREAARTARALGAVDAVNLDSGGSTTMTVGSRVNRPSDPAGERPVANGLFVLPGP